MSGENDSRSGTFGLSFDRQSFEDEGDFEDADLFGSMPAFAASLPSHIAARSVPGGSGGDFEAIGSIRATAVARVGEDAREGVWNAHQRSFGGASGRDGNRGRSDPRGAVPSPSRGASASSSHAASGSRAHVGTAVGSSKVAMAQLAMTPGAASSAQIYGHVNASQLMQQQQLAQLQ